MDRIVDSSKIEQACRMLIEGIGQDPDTEGFRDTPRRFREMFENDFAPNGDPKEVLGRMVMKEHYDQMIVVSDIMVRSFCEHHMLPWWGRAWVGYVPHEKAVGLSKITRMVDSVCRGFTIQERVTDTIVDTMQEVLAPKGSMAILKCVHACVIMRGVRAESQEFKTSATRGIFLTNPAARQEFQSLVSM